MLLVNQLRHQNKISERTELHKKTNSTKFIFKMFRLVEEVF